MVQDMVMLRWHGKRAGGVCGRVPQAEPGRVCLGGEHCPAGRGKGLAWMICRPEARFHAAGRRYPYMAEYVCRALGAGQVLPATIGADA